MYFHILFFTTLFLTKHNARNIFDHLTYCFCHLDRVEEQNPQRTKVKFIKLFVFQQVVQSHQVICQLMILSFSHSHSATQLNFYPQNQGSDDLNYAAVTFHPKTDRNHRPAPDREVEPNVIYSSMR